MVFACFCMVFAGWTSPNIFFFPRMCRQVCLRDMRRLISVDLDQKSAFMISDLTTHAMARFAARPWIVAKKIGLAPVNMAMGQNL